jgi:hypothetical protein
MDTGFKTCEPNSNCTDFKTKFKPRMFHKIKMNELNSQAKTKQHYGHCTTKTRNRSVIAKTKIATLTAADNSVIQTGMK